VETCTFIIIFKNGQYIFEGLTAGFLFTLGGFGMICLNWITDKNMTLNNKWIFFGIGVGSLLISYNVLNMFIRMKVGGN
jgi:hypothetical protein